MVAIRIHSNAVRHIMSTAFGKPTAEAVAAEIFVSPNVAEIFVRGFWWVQKKRYFFGLYAGDERNERARSNSRYRTAKEDFADLIGSASARFSRASTDDRSTLGARTFEEVRRVFVDHLTGAEDTDVFPVLLALLHTIDRQYGRRIREDFFKQRGARFTSMPINPKYAFPRHWGAFSTRKMKPSALPPRYFLRSDFLRLERYFASLAVTPDPNESSPVPALHMAGAEQKVYGFGSWTIAVVDVLASHKELSVKTAGGAFWVPAFETHTATEGSSPPASVLQQRLVWALDKCRKYNAQLITLPELSADETMAQTVGRSLLTWDSDAGGGVLPLVLMGRLHEVEDPARDRYRNRPEVVTPDGRLPWDYWKSNPFEFWKAGKLYREALGDGSERIVALDTPVGRVAVVVCLDFLNVDFLKALLQMRPNVVVVLAMTPGTSIGKFRSFAGNLAAGSGAVTILCNSSFHHRRGHEPAQDGSTRGSSPQVLSFVCNSTRVPNRTPMKAHPLRPPNAEAIVSVYKLTSSKEGLKIQKRSEWM